MEMRFARFGRIVQAVLVIVDLVRHPHQAVVMEHANPLNPVHPVLVIVGLVVGQDLDQGLLQRVMSSQFSHVQRLFGRDILIVNGIVHSVQIILIPVYLMKGDVPRITYRNVLPPIHRNGEI